MRKLKMTTTEVERILKFEPENNPFNIVYVDITHRCQMACSNCYLPNRSIPDMELSPLYELLDKLPRKVDIRLIGGEPTLRDDLVSIIKEIVKRGHRPMLITNGLKLSDRDYCRQLKDAGLEYAQISLNGFDDDKLYQILDQMICAEKKMAAVENCNEVGIGVSLAAIIVKNLNEKIISPMINYARQLKLPVRINLRNVGDLGRSMTGKIENYTFEELISLTAHAIKASPDELLKHKVSRNQLRYPLKLGSKRSEVIWIKLTDWNQYPKEIKTVATKSENIIKGRVTEDFKIAPFFDHVKQNEFGY